MKIIYVTHTRFPTEKAHGHQVAQVCQALTELGHEVTIVAPTVWNEIKDDAHAYYHLPAAVRVVHLEHFDALLSPFVPGFLGFAVSMFFYKRALKTFLKAHHADLLYARSPHVVPTLLKTRCPVIVELHELPRRFRGSFVRVCNRCAKVVCLTSPMQRELVALGVGADRIVVEGDGVSLDRFTSLPTAAEAKEAWHLRPAPPVVGYVGSFVTREKIEKGVETLIDALVLLKERGVKVQGWFVGGPHPWMVRLEAYARFLGLAHDDARFEGAVRPVSVPRALAACDVLVYPAPASDHPYFQRDTSPLKLFEYLAADRRIVCADLPPIRDVVDLRAVDFCTPGDAVSLADAIMSALKEDPATKSAERRRIAQEHSWKKRMERIMSSL